MNFFKMTLAAAAMLLAPIAAHAVTVTGQIDISGTVNLGTSTFTATGNADLDDPGTVIFASGDFATYTSAGSSASLSDIDFTTPGLIWSVGGFTFTASSFDSFVNTTTKAFHAVGTLAGHSFDATVGTLSFTTQVNSPNQAVASFSSTTAPVPVPAAGLLLLTALGGAAALRRRKKAAAA